MRKYISKNNQILIDGAHNPLAASAIIKYLDTLDKERKIIMILGMMANKDHKKFIQIFKDRIHSIITLNIPNQINFMEKDKLSSNSVLIGNSTQITEQLKGVEAAGIDEVILYFNVGHKPNALVKEQMHKFMEEVAPNFENYTGQIAAE